MNRDLLKLSGLCLLVSFVCGGLIVSCGCASGPSPVLMTGEVTDRISLLRESPGWMGDENYAVLWASALPRLQDDFEAALFRSAGITRWDGRFDCNRMVGMWLGVAQAKFAASVWHSPTKANALALAEVWFRRDDTGTLHAIVQAKTSEGMVYWEPHPPGARLTLSEAEKKSIYFRKW